jgi:hypothetical protein
MNIQVKVNRVFFVCLLGVTLGLALVGAVYLDGKQTIEDAYEIASVEVSTSGELLIYPALQPTLPDASPNTKAPFPNGLVVSDTDNKDSLIAARLALPGDWVSFERSESVNMNWPIPITGLKLKCVPLRDVFTVSAVHDGALADCYLLETSNGVKFSVLEMIYPREKVKVGMVLEVQYRAKSLTDGTKQVFWIQQPSPSRKSKPVVINGVAYAMRATPAFSFENTLVLRNG